MGHVQFETVYEEVLRSIGRLGHTVTTVTAAKRGRHEDTKAFQRTSAVWTTSPVNATSLVETAYLGEATEVGGATSHVGLVTVQTRSGYAGHSQTLRAERLSIRSNAGFRENLARHASDARSLVGLRYRPRAGMSGSEAPAHASALSDRAAGPARRPDPRAVRMARTVGAVRATTTRSHRAAKMSPSDSRTLIAMNGVVNHTVERGDWNNAYSSGRR